MLRFDERQVWNTDPKRYDHTSDVEIALDCNIIYIIRRCRFGCMYCSTDEIFAFVRFADF